MVTRGSARLSDAAGPIGTLTPRAPGYVPATLEGRYGLATDEGATVLLLAAPGARGGAPRI